MYSVPSQGKLKKQKLTINQKDIFNVHLISQYSVDLSPFTQEIAMEMDYVIMEHAIVIMDLQDMIVEFNAQGIQMILSVLTFALFRNLQV